MPQPHWAGRNPEPAGTTGGPTSLTDLTDVTGTPGPSKSPVGDPAGQTFTLTEVPTQADLDQILANVAEVTWRPLQLQDPRLTPFSTQDARFADPAWRLTLNNVVHIQGQVACIPPISDADTGLTIATLDPDSRPLATLLFGCPAFNNNARVDVNPDGTIIFQGMLIGGGEIDWFSLSMITFSVG
jgi:hypothetical protein